MKSRKLLRFWGLLLVATVPVWCATKARALETNSIRLAIGPFFAPVGNTALEKAATDLPDLLTASLSHENRFQLVEREKINAVWSELHLAEAGLASADTIGKLGRILSCDWLISGSFVQTESGAQVWVKVIDTQNGVVLDLQSVRYNPTNFSATVSNAAAFLAQASPRASARQFITLGRFADLSVSSTREDWSQRLPALIEKHFLAAGYGVVEREAVTPIFSEFQLQTAGLTGDSTNQVKLKPAFWVVDGGCKWIYDTQDKLSVALRVQKMGGGEQNFRFTKPPGAELEEAVVAAIQSALTNTTPITSEQAQIAEANFRATRAQELARGRDEPWIPSRYTTNKTVFALSFKDQNGKTIVFTNEDQNRPVFEGAWFRNVGGDWRNALEQAILLNTNDMRSKFMLGRGLFLSSDSVEKQHGRDLLEEVAASNDATNAAKARTWLTSMDQTGHPPGWRPTVILTNQPEPDLEITNVATAESAVQIPLPDTGLIQFHNLTLAQSVPDGILVVADNVLQRYNPQTGEDDNVHLPLKLDHPITAIETDENDLWLGTDGGGLIRIPKSGGVPRVFGETNGFPMPSIRSLRLVPGRLLIGFGFRESGAFGYLDTKTEKFTGLMSEVNLFKPGQETVNNPPERSILAIQTADNTNIWVASDIAIYHLDLASQQWTMALPLTASLSGWRLGPQSLSVNPCFVAALMPSRCVAICKLPENKWTTVNVSKDFDENEAFSVCADRYDNQLLWIGGNRKIVLFNVATMKIAGVCNLYKGTGDNSVHWIFAGPDSVAFIADIDYPDEKLYRIPKPGHAAPVQKETVSREPKADNQQQEFLQKEGPFQEPMADKQQREFLQKNFAKFVPVQFQKDTNGSGRALIQRLPVKENMFTYRGRYYCGFKFTVPSWLDGHFGLVHLLAKTEAEKDFTANGMSWNIIPETGPAAEFESFHSDSIASYSHLQRQFPYTHQVKYQFLASNRLEPGKTYAIWFGFQEKDMPDIAFAINISSLRGRNEYGLLPLW